MSATLSLVLSSSFRSLPGARTVQRSWTALPRRNRCYSDYAASKDPSHPHLYYHPLPKDRLALSFLPDAPIPTSRTILGFLPLHEEAGLNDFQENPKFLTLLHEAISDGVDKNVCPTVETEAFTRPGDGYLHIGDERKIPPAGRIGETEDLIGSVLVQDHKVVPGSYEAQPMYRICTSDGILILPAGLDEHVVDVLQKVAKKEAAGTGEVS